MRNIAGRIERLEKMMSVGKDRRIDEIIITGPVGGCPPDEQKLRDSLGPPETWLTHQEQLAAAREDQTDCDHRLTVIELSVERELQARESQNTPLADKKRAERVQEYRAAFQNMLGL